MGTCTGTLRLTALADSRDFWNLLGFCKVGCYGLVACGQAPHSSKGSTLSMSLDPLDRFTAPAVAVTHVTE